MIFEGLVLKGSNMKTSAKYWLQKSKTTHIIYRDRKSENYNKGMKDTNEIEVSIYSILNTSLGMGISFTKAGFIVGIFATKFRVVRAECSLGTIESVPSVWYSGYWDRVTLNLNKFHLSQRTDIAILQDTKNRY